MIIEISDKDFEQKVLLSNSLVIVDFWAPWCGPCKNLFPILEKISIKYLNELLMFKLNVDNNSIYTDKYTIRSIPTLIFFKKGEEKHRKTGSSSEEDIINKIDFLLKN